MDLVTAITAIVVAVGVYAAIGVLFGVVYLLRIAPPRDAALGASAVHVRLLLLPGTVAIWPVLLFRPTGRGAEPEGESV